MNETTIVVAVTAETELEWEPGESARFEWGGALYVGRIVLERTTAAGTISPGQTLRIYVELVDAKLPGDPTSLAVEAAGGDAFYVSLARTR